MRRCAIIFIMLLVFLHSISQNTIGIPNITNYSKNVYEAGMQNWDMAQDKNGVMYFANNDGLLSFDGTYWKVYPLPNKTNVRSIAIGKDNKIYVGGQGEIGFFSPNEAGELEFTSLLPLISTQNQSFNDVWDIISYGNDVFFRSPTKMFQLTDKSINTFQAPSEWKFLGFSNNKLIAQDAKNGMLQFKNGMWMPFVDEKVMPPNYLVTALFPFGKDTTIFTTIKSGLFIITDNKISKFTFAKENPLINQRVLTAIPINNDWMVVATNLSGCYIISRKGEVIQNLSRKEGLQNNNIVSMLIDRNKNLWLGLDNGIDFIAYSNSIKHIYPEDLNEGAGYTSIVFKNDLYIGTSNGLYKIPISNNKDISFTHGNFEAIPASKGSTWGLSEVNGHLLLGHHEGAFLINGSTLVPLSNKAGYWKFLPYSNVMPSSLVIAGTYKGIDLFDYNDGSFSFKSHLPNFNESSRYLTIDNNTVWVAHTYRGIFKINISNLNAPEVNLYTEKNGLPTTIKNHLYKIKNRIVVTTEKGIFEYNPKEDNFVESNFFKSLLGQKNIRHLYEDPEGNIWFVENKSLGVIDFEGASAKIIYFPELHGRIVTDFEHVYAYNQNNIFVGSEKGFYHINYEQYKRNSYNVQVKISSVKAIGDKNTLIFGGYFGQVNETAGQQKDNIPEINHNQNSLHFEYSSPSYERQSNVTYSYHLKGFEKSWSAWSKKAEKDYTYLPPGTYTFEVKAKSNLGSESAVSSYTFTVLPPWYRTGIAYVIYVLLFVALMYLLYRYQLKTLKQQQAKHEEEQKRLQYLHQLEISKSEKEIIALKNERLQSEIEFKNSELASVAMHLVQKGELLTKIKEELMRIKKDLNIEKPSTEFKKLIRILNEEDKMNDDWAQFAKHFDKVHSDFLKEVKDAYPKLSASELKLCAYLRMNLSSKEIAQLLNISVRGVEISRYRLRKKLQIPTETNLFDFLMEFSSAKVE